jgi:hypothetical protein
MTPAMKIESYRPRNHAKWELREDGSRHALLFEEHGMVEVVAYSGGVHGQPFTTLGMYLDGRCYHCRLPRRYHDRWIPRLARDFDWECSKLANAAGGGQS